MPFFMLGTSFRIFEEELQNSNSSFCTTRHQECSTVSTVSKIFPEEKFFTAWLMHKWKFKLVGDGAFFQIELFTLTERKTVGSAPCQAIVIFLIEKKPTPLEQTFHPMSWDLCRKIHEWRHLISVHHLQFLHPQLFVSHQRPSPGWE